MTAVVSCRFEVPLRTNLRLNWLGEIEMKRILAAAVIAGAWANPSVAETLTGQVHISAFSPVADGPEIESDQAFEKQQDRNERTYPEMHTIGAFCWLQLAVWPSSPGRMHRSSPILRSQMNDGIWMAEISGIRKFPV